MANLLSQPGYSRSQRWCWERRARSSPKPWSPATAIADEASEKDFKDILSLNHRTLLVADPHRCKSTKFGGAGARARYQKSTAIPLDTNRGEEGIIFSKPMMACGVVCYGVWLHPPQNSDPDLIFTEKLNRFNRSTIIFVAIYQKNVYSNTEMLESICARGKKIGGYACDTCQSPAGTSCIYREERKMASAFREVSINSGFKQVWME